MKIIIITLVLTITFIACSNLPAFALSPTVSITNMQERIDERIELAKNKPKAMLGTITDKTNDSVQIKDIKDNIQVISINNNSLSVIKDGTKPITIKYSDLAIGDFLLIMGYFDERNVLLAKRIMVISKPISPQKEITVGIIDGIVKRDLTLNVPDAPVKTLIFPKKWDGPEIKELQSGMKVAIVAIPNSSKLEIRTLKILN